MSFLTLGLANSLTRARLMIQIMDVIKDATFVSMIFLKKSMYVCKDEVDKYIRLDIGFHNDETED